MAPQQEDRPPRRSLIIDIQPKPSLRTKRAVDRRALLRLSVQTGLFIVGLVVLFGGLTAVLIKLRPPEDARPLAADRSADPASSCGDEGAAFLALRKAAVAATTVPVVRQLGPLDDGTTITRVAECEVEISSANFVRFPDSSIVKDAYSGEVVLDRGSGTWTVENLNFAAAGD